MTLGTKTSVPYAGVRGRNESAAHGSLSGSRDQEEYMNRFGSLFKPLMWSMALLLAAFVTGCGGGGGGGAGGNALFGGGGVGGIGQGPALLNLKSISTNNNNFVILAETAITDVPFSPITGNIGLSPATGANIDVTCAEMTGTIYTVDAAYVGSGDVSCAAPGPGANKTLVDNAVLDMVTAYNDAAGRTAPAPITELGAGDIGGMTLAPGLYKWSSGLLIPTDVTLSGGANDVWIFQIAQDLTVSNGQTVRLAGGALAKNVFWQVGGGTGVAIGTTATVEGTILAAKAITLNTGAVVHGRLLAQSAVTLNANTVSAP
jgi:hypothetical protein